MFPFFCRRITAAIHSSRSVKHDPLPHCISWEFSNSRGPSERMSPPSAVQTLVPLSGFIWSVGWSHYPASLYVTHRMLSMTAISVNRLPALFLGLRYKQVVTTESTSIILATVWALPGVSTLCYISDYRITLWRGYICVISSLVNSIVSYAKIFRTLIYH